MKRGDFTNLAKHYHSRPGYSLNLLHAIATHIGAKREGFFVADIGAGTGKLTENLVELGFQVHAVEPNDPMRQEGEKHFKNNPSVLWLKGSGEITGLKDNTYDWVLMGSSFHWTDPAISLREFHRILKPNGYFTAIWNPRDLERSAIEKEIDQTIKEMIPSLNRVSSGAKHNTKDWESVLTAESLFSDCLFMEASHEVRMDRNRYLEVWKSVNDIQSQAGEVLFSQILNKIENRISSLEEVSVHYRTRAWTVKKARS